MSTPIPPPDTPQPGKTAAPATPPDPPLRADDVPALLAKVIG